ncbi:DegT/DnrJ/EryC1/StrS family aminotransferase, partial [Candidatus Pacearchaeota archaeon]|nr:DegT/DnrJ/EryC1/StrS family aminotransferase [Candidatus Pacearchaeota archaeon]
FTKYIGVRHTIGTGSGTSALQVALMALGVGSGDEVILPAMTFYATGEVVALLGAQPIFVDIDPKTFNLNLEKVEASITKNTRVILPVHLYGQPVDMDPLDNIAKQYGIKILEDCAHSTGATYNGNKVGNLGTMGAFSFYPGKNIGSIGEAGAITTNDDHLAQLCREYRDHGSIKKFIHNRIGLNARMDGLQAAVLSVKLPHLDSWNESRRRIVKQYLDLLSNKVAELPQKNANIDHVYHIFQVQIEQRDKVFRLMREHGVEVNMHYPVPMHLHPGFAYLKYKKGDFPVAERLADRTLSLPCYPEMKEKQVNKVIDILNDVLSKQHFKHKCK